MSQLICVRHGESRANVILHQLPRQEREAVVLEEANPPLSEIGLKQAEELGVFLADELREAPKPLRILTSQLQRTCQTAQPLVDQLQNQEFTLERWSDLNEKHERVVGVRQRETLQEFISRVKPVAQKLLAQQWEGTTVLVGHSVFISALISILLNPSVELEDLVYRNPNCAITRFLRDEQGKVTLLMQGSVEHLSPDIRTGVD